ncbi:TetR/AcrR family transcriptional regulator [Nocardia nova]|uniref:TetR/AcrR family transcriptional regulator n=1 Tax=Nocardia nova TaxID=37330 RepID=UPI003720E1CC
MSRTDTAVNSATAATVLQILSGGAAPPLPRHRHDLSREDVRETQRARVVAAAIELFADTGYAPTSVQEITKRAGVSRKTFYELYATKEDVFLDAYQAVDVLVRETRLTDGEPEAYDLETLTEITQRLLLLMAVAPAATRMFFLEALGAGPRVRARRNEAIDEFVAAITPALQKARAVIEPELPPLTIDHCRILVAAGIELITEYLADHEPETLATLTPRITRAARVIVIPTYIESD